MRKKTVDTLKQYLQQLLTTIMWSSISGYSIFNSCTNDNKKTTRSKKFGETRAKIRYWLPKKKEGSRNVEIATVSVLLSKEGTGVYGVK
mmetsp:Transcript_23069/g.23333  ORF Transcript_23069/g.23333 Transcript_23069/m.23333 type:complete len:89 (+) Transcript_23069:176-442(+)